jgi:hypothetical protein
MRRKKIARLKAIILIMKIQQICCLERGKFKKRAGRQRKITKI